MQLFSGPYSFASCFEKIEYSFETILSLPFCFLSPEGCIKSAIRIQKTVESAMMVTPLAVERKKNSPGTLYNKIYYCITLHSDVSHRCLFNTVWHFYFSFIDIKEVTLKTRTGIASGPRTDVVLTIT